MFGRLGRLLELAEYRQKIIESADVLKALSHPIRLCIACKLSLYPLNVSQLQGCLEVPQANVSQHLSVLKMKGVIKGERNGNEIFYSLANDEVRRLVGGFFTKEDIPE